MIAPETATNSLPYTRQKAAYSGISVYFLLVTGFFYNPAHIISTMYYVLMAVTYGLLLTWLLLKWRSHKMVVVAGESIKVNTHLKSYQVMKHDVRRVVMRKSGKYVYFERLNGEKVELDITDFDEGSRDRFIIEFQVIPEEDIDD